MRRAILFTPLIASFVVGCRPPAPTRADNAGLPPCDNGTATALRVAQVLAIHENLPVVVEGYLVKGSDICLVCEDGPNTFMSTESVRLADVAAATSNAGLGLNSKSKNYHCWNRGGSVEHPCSVIAAGQHVRIRALYVFRPTGDEGSYLDEPDICVLRD